MSDLLKTRPRNSAFTLVELLVVIAIIGILASLAAVGVMKVLERSKMVVARIEISQLEAAVSAAKLDLGNVDELPSVIRLYNTPAGFAGDAVTFDFLNKAFGKSWQANAACPWMGASYSGSYPVTLTGMEALVFWLGGIRDTSGLFQGFSSAKATPWDITTTKRKGPYYDFDTKRIVTNANIPSYVNSWEGPYLYISKTFYNSGPFSGVNAYRKVNTTTASSYYNAKTFQLISSGQDQSFGPGGVYNPPFAIGTPGYDDLANFSSTQLGKKDE